RMGPKKTPFALRHWDRDVFFYQPAGEMAGGPSGVTFWVGPERRAMRGVVENLDGHGQGTFTRVPGDGGRSGWTAAPCCVRGLLPQRAPLATTGCIAPGAA